MSPRPQVLSTVKIEPRYRYALEQHADFRDASGCTRDEILEQAAEIRCLITDHSFVVDEVFLKAALSASDELKHIALIEPRTDNVDLELVALNKLWLTQVDVYAKAAAEAALAMILNASWNLSDISASRDSVRDKTLGIIGYGNVGQQLAPLAEAVGMRVIYTCEHPRKQDAYRSLKQLLVQADIISLHLPETASKELLFAKRFQLMRPGVIIVNTGSQAIINEADLKAAVDSGIVQAYSADKQTKEPRDHKQLFYYENLVQSSASSVKAANRQVCETVSQLLANQSPPESCLLNHPQD